MADVFLSYNRASKQMAQDFVDQLRRRGGYTVWWDQEMSGGENWIKEVNRHQAAAKATIVLWTRKCFSDEPEDRGHVTSEVLWAQQNEQVVIPLTIPPFDWAQLRPPFNALQTYRFNEYDLICRELARQGIDPSGEPAPVRYECQDVFKTSGELRHTLVRRETIAGYRDLRANIRAQGMIVRLHGDTQSGKTQFALHALDEMRPFQLHGKAIKSVDDIYDTIAANEPDIPRDNRSAVTRYIKDMQRPVMIDDFHWVRNESLYPDDPERLQHDVIEEFRQYRDDNISLLLISIPDCAARWLGNEVGMRSVAIEMPGWTERQLRPIADAGFARLRVRFHPSVIDELVSQSHRNPALLQKFCLRLCHAKNIWESFETETARAVSRLELQRVFRNVAEEIYGDRIKTMVESGQKYTLNGGARRITLDALLLKVLDLRGGFQQLTTNTVRRTIRDERLVEQSELRRITEDAILKAGQQFIMQLREAGLAETTLGLEDERFFLQHPSFKVHLHWKLMPDLKLGEPALGKFVEHTKADLLVQSSTATEPAGD